MASAADSYEGEEILDNIDGCVQGPIGGFLKRHFGTIHCVLKGSELEMNTAEWSGLRCPIPLTAPSSDSFLSWFSDYMSQQLDGARGSWKIYEHNSAENGACLILTMPSLPVCDEQTQPDWAHVQVIGHFYQQTCVSYQDGLSSLIKTDEGGNYIVLDNKATPSLRKLYLESQPIASREALVGTGTVCYRARLPVSDRWSYVLKLKWRWARDRPEDELLKLAQERCVWGSMSLTYYKEVESTANLRRGLRWGRQRQFTGTHHGEKDASVLEHKQKDTPFTNGLVDHTEETNNFFQNRILACMLTSPVDRPIHTFQSVLELLQVFYDAIKCHRSLFCDAKILHQDISSGNIIILDGQDDGVRKGILIDLDSAVQVADGLEPEAGITGTRPFMAIGVLKGEAHTYRHDLESFLYVLLWVVITNHKDNPPETSRLRQWSNGDWEELGARKALDMDHDGFSRLLEEFPPEFDSVKPLAENLRQVLFPLQKEVQWADTGGLPGDIYSLYNRAFRAFEEAITSPELIK